MEKISKKSAKGTSKSPTSSASFQSAANIGRETAFQLMKAKQAEKDNTAVTIQPFKRVEMKLQSSSNGSSKDSGPSTPTKPTGLAGFAASISRTTASASASSSTAINSSTSLSKNSTAPSKAPTTSASLSKADKRIQQMKKKASSKKMLYDK